MSDLPLDGPCAPWATDDDLDVVGCDTPDVDMGVWLQAATDLLYARTGSRWRGECEITVRPCGANHPGCGPAGLWQTGVDRFEWWWNGWADCSGGRCDRGPSVIRLPWAPVAAVSSVILDGDLLVEGVDWRLDSNRLLRRLDGRWPTCQTIDAPIGDPGTWAVTYTPAWAPPTAGRLAAAAWACHLARMATPGDGACVLPAGVERMSRQSVEVVMASASEILEAGRTGIELVDQFLAAYPPKRRARFRDPDSERYVVSNDLGGS